MDEYQKLIITIILCVVMYYMFCKCFENFESEPYKVIPTKYSKKYMPDEKENKKDEHPNENGWGFATNLLPSNETTQENYFDSLNNPVDVSSVELPLERQFHSTGPCRNANLNLRAEPPNPKIKVGPWNDSTIQHCGSKPLDGLGVDMLD